MINIDQPVPLFVGPGFYGDPDLELRFPPEYSDEILGLLDDEGIAHGTALEFSAGADLWIETVRVVGSAAGLTSLASVIHTVVNRHSKKRFQLKRDGGFEVAADGYSKKAVQQLLDEAVSDKTALDRRVAEQMGAEEERKEQ
ncbi:hypothetical protein QE367_002970 [Microbacterium paludicola]|uniref:Uncharacterized protein n=1 Tax=Microbacterium paludicola TaxID=300019 RepID=A0ABU1I544_9MICO|nr:hypothetical protein [Microbacterium paludicola]MDR6168766.1 hypothetical protein [Microbacterium paludicola]